MWLKKPIPARFLAIEKERFVGAYATKSMKRCLQPALVRRQQHTCIQSVVKAFIFITYSQLAKLSLNVASDSLRFFIASTFVCSASVSSKNSAIAGSRNPRPCGASGYAPERERRKREPWDTRRRGVRCGVCVGGILQGSDCLTRDDDTIAVAVQSSLTVYFTQPWRSVLSIWYIVCYGLFS